MAAKIERRGISLFIDGKEIKNDVKSIEKEFYKLRAELKKSEIGSEEYNKKLQKMGALKNILDNHNKAIRETAQEWEKTTKATQKNEGAVSKLMNFAKGLLPAFGFAAIAAGAKAAFNQVVNSTDTLSTKYEVFMGGMKEATKEFWRTLATGNWNNFMSNMRTAIEVGREYERVLDDIEARQRGLAIAEADSRLRMRTLEDTVRNVSLSNDVRVAAAEERIKLEEELAAKRTKIAKEQYDNEVMLTLQASKLSKEKLMEVVSDIDSEKKLAAERYQNKVDEYERLKKLNVTTVGGGMYGGSLIALPETSEMKALSNEISSTSAETIGYAKQLEQLGNVTDEQLNKMVASYAKVKEAEASALENTKRVRSAMYSIFDEENRKMAGANGGSAPTPQTPGDLSSDGNFEKIKAGLDLAFKEELNTLKDQFLQKKLTKQQFNQEMYELELSQLVAMRGLYQEHSSDFIEIEGQIIDKKLAWSQQFDQMMQTSLAITEALTEDEKNLFADIDAQMDQHLTEYKAKLDQETLATIEAEEKKAEAREKAKEVEIQNSVAASAAAVENAETIEEAGKAVLNSIREQIRAYLLEAIAIQVVKALKSVPFPLNIAAAAVAGGATSLLFNKLVPKFATGGFTEGAEMYVAGEAGTEWIAPNKMIKSPVTGPVIAALENFRKNGHTGPSDMAVQYFANGGYTANEGYTRNSNKSTLEQAAKSESKEINNLIRNLSFAVDQLAKNVEYQAKNTPRPVVAVEMIEKGLKNYVEIQQTRGL
jgi:hypothetical protein